jgi:sialidase-1
MVLRTWLGTIFRAESHDGGETWTGLRSMEVVAPASPSRIVRIPGSEDLLLIWNWSYDPVTGNGVRRPLACAISSDGGDTWPWSRRKALEDDPSATYHYPSCLFVGDRAFVTYQSSPTPAPGEPPRRVRELKTVWLPTSWLYAS